MKKICLIFLTGFVFLYSTAFCQSGDLKSTSQAPNVPIMFQHTDKAANNCNYEQIGNSFENGYRNDVGGSYEHADDITIPANEFWTISEIISSHFVNGGITSLNIKIYEDAVGIPGSPVANFTGVTSFTSEIIGNNYGMDIYEADATLPSSIELYGGPAGKTYWLSIMVTPVDAGVYSYWESQTVYPYGSQFAQDDGGGWFILGDGNLVFQVIYAVSTQNDVTLCPGESIFLEGAYQTEPGVYYDTLTSYMGCDSIVTTDLSFYPEIDVTVTQLGGTYTVNEAGADYQWVDCNDDYAPVAGETNQSFSPLLSGYYAVIVTQGSCSDTSDCFYFPNGLSTCNYVQIGNNFENGYGNEIGGSEIIADDVFIPSNQCWNITEIISSHFVNGGIASMDITVYSDEGGIPGDTIANESEITSFAQDSIAYVYSYDIYQADATLPEPIALCGGPSGTTYWLSIMVTPVEAGNLSYWESQTAYNYGNTFLYDNGTGWADIGVGNLVFQLIFPVVTTNDVTLCYGEGMVLEGAYRTEPGTYYDTLSSSMGCDSMVITNLSFYPVIDVTVTDAGSKFTANETGAGYKWVDCNDGYSPISGETGQSFTPTTTGDYAVIVTVGSCSDTSECFHFSVTGLQNISKAYCTIYPNPNKGQFTIELAKFEANTTVEIYNTTGDILWKKELTGNIQHIEAGTMEVGIYFIKITNDKRQLVEKIVIQ
jgi:hypothetical protein